MIIKKVKIPIYEINVTFIELDKDDSNDCVLSYLGKVKADDDEVEIIRDNIKSKAKNGGVTYFNRNLHEMLLIIFPSSSDKQRRNTINHELYHVVDNVGNCCNLECAESRAYLQGYLSEILY